MVNLFIIRENCYDKNSETVFFEIYVILKKGIKTFSGKIRVTKQNKNIVYFFQKKKTYLHLNLK